VFAVVGQAIWPAAPPARYHTLAGVAALAAGNVVVIFRPDTRERELRATLEASHARVVDGPTAADAYVLRVPASQRLAALATLRARPDITLAEPIDAPP
jgi:acyl-CoA synthetase (AMP-forming)/AMP-acid ligase II